MARNLVSAGISFGEIDLSQVAQVTALMGPAIVGTTQSGPAFKPITVNNYSTEFVPIYGGLNTSHYVPYTTKFYLQYGSNASICRILGTNSSAPAKDAGFIVPASAVWYDIVGGIAGTASTTSERTTGLVPLAVLRERNGATIGGITATCGLSSGVLTWSVGLGAASAAATLGTYTFNVDNIESVFTRDPINIPASPACTALYLDVFYYTQSSENAADPHTSRSTLSDLAYDSMTACAPGKLSGTDLTGAYDHAVTPWIVGAPDVNGAVQDLFRFHSLSDGSESNNDCKISIDNITRKTDSFGNPYFTFDVLVRKVDDSDLQMQIYERFSGCNLLKSDRNYIVKKIGDTAETFNTTYSRMDISGTWPNKSKFIRIEVSEGIPMHARPSGFKAPESVTKLSDLELVAYPYRNFKVSQASGNSLYKKSIFLGYDGLSIGASEMLYGCTNGEATSYKGIILFDNGIWSASADELNAAKATSLTADFHTIAMFPNKTKYEQAINANKLAAAGVDWKFTVPMFGGRDGYKKSLGGSDLITALSGDFEKAMTLLSNSDIYDFNMLVIPGTIASYSPHAGIIENGINMVETRGDAFYIADMFALTADNASEPDSTTLNTFDSSYAATYWPWIKIYDNENEDFVWVPPSVLVLAQLAYNDKIAYPWYAPAGVNRGQIANAVSTRYTLNQDDRDVLYDARVNPIATFRNEGIVIWGQKTLQKTQTALDRVNVRRLLVYAKKLIAGIGIKLLFEPNNATTWNKFKQQVNPILADIAANNGLENFLVIMDNTTNTPDRIDRNEMYGQIKIVPTRAVEALYVDFIINNSGVEFNN